MNLKWLIAALLKNGCRQFRKWGCISVCDTLSIFRFHWRFSSWDARQFDDRTRFCINQNLSSSVWLVPGVEAWSFESKGRTWTWFTQGLSGSSKLKLLFLLIFHREQPKTLKLQLKVKRDSLKILIRMKHARQGALNSNESSHQKIINSPT